MRYPYAEIGMQRAVAAGILSAWIICNLLTDASYVDPDTVTGMLSAAGSFFLTGDKYLWASAAGLPLAVVLLFLRPFFAPVYGRRRRGYAILLFSGGFVYSGIVTFLVRHCLESAF